MYDTLPRTVILAVSTIRSTRDLDLSSTNDVATTTNNPPNSNVAIVVSIIAAIATVSVLLLLLLGVAICAVVVYNKKKQVAPNQSDMETTCREAQLKEKAPQDKSDPNPVYEEVPASKEPQHATDSHFIMTPSTAYGMVNSLQLPDVMTQNTAYDVSAQDVMTQNSAYNLDM